MLRRLPPPPEPPEPPFPALAPPLLLEPVDVMLPPFPLWPPAPPPPFPPLPARAPPLFSLPGPAMTEPPFPPEAAKATLAESVAIIKIEAADIITFLTIGKHTIPTAEWPATAFCGVAYAML